MAIAFPTRTASLTSAADAILKSATDAKLEWKSIDTTSMPTELLSAYNDYKAAQAHAANLREEFEAIACGPIGKLLSIRPGFDVAFGYKFGQLSVAIAPKREPRAKANALRF